MKQPLPETEERDERSAGLDLLSTPALVGALASAQRRAFEAVIAESAAIARAVDAIAERMERGGKLHYVGAGTSGRLATLDAAEMPPTFGTSPDLVCAHIAGGKAALVGAVEGAEDDEGAADEEMRDHVHASDAVVGISAGGAAPYVLAALRAAHNAGAFTAAIVNCEPSPIAALVDVAIVLRTGAEPLAGSTRMKAGTAAKITLNTLSTAVMVRLGRVYDNLMVDVVATNEKLRGRANRLVRQLTGLDESQAASLLAAASGSVKVATVMARRNIDAPGARALLATCGGRLRSAL